MDRIVRTCTQCGTTNTIEPTKGLGGVATWKAICNECGSETEGHRSQKECKPGEPFADATIFD